MQTYIIFVQREPVRRDGTIRDNSAGIVQAAYHPELQRVGSLRASSPENALELAKQIWGGPLLCSTGSQFAPSAGQFVAKQMS